MKGNGGSLAREIGSRKVGNLAKLGQIMICVDLSGISARITPCPSPVYSVIATKQHDIHISAATRFLFYLKLQSIIYCVGQSVQV